MEGRAGRVQREVLEGLNAGLSPALAPRPLHHEHVVSKRLPKHQGLVGTGLLLRRMCYLQLQIRSLRKDTVI